MEREEHFRSPSSQKGMSTLEQIDFQYNSVAFQAMSRALLSAVIARAKQHATAVCTDAGSSTISSGSEIKELTEGSCEGTRHRNRGNTGEVPSPMQRPLF